MSTAALSISPFATSNAGGFFGTISDGLVQGVAMDDPAVRNYLAGGTLDTSETLLMYGGVLIYEYLSTPGTQGTNPLQNTVGRATSLTKTATKGAQGFAVFNQAYAGLITPSSPVPTFGSGQSINFYRFGSGARIAVAMNPALVSLEGGAVGQQVSWDYVNQQLTPYAAAYPATTITGATWASTSGGQVTFTVGTDLTSFLSAGDYIQVSGVVNTGGTGTGIYNGNFAVVSITSTTIVVTYKAASSPGTYASGGTVAAGGGALPAVILQVQPSNCKTVVYNSVTNSATWNNNGAAALIQL
jgi:hypothetical protein